MGDKDFSLANGGSARDAKIMPLDQAAMLTPIADIKPHSVRVQPMPITGIPSAMRKMGWEVSAALMKRWFDSPQFIMPPEWKSDAAPPAASTSLQYIDNTTVTMSWALKFKRLQEAFDHLRGRWNIDAAADVLVTRLYKSGWDGIGDWPLGHWSMDARKLEDTSYINSLSVGGLTDTLDDMYGALGVCNLHMAVVGRALTDNRTGRRIFQIHQCGFYIKDYYDFNGSQYLGLWTEDGVASKASLAGNSALEIGQAFFSHEPAYLWRGGSIGHVYNKTFQAYRKAENKGGDFFIYSDVLWVDLNEPLDLESALARRMNLAVRNR